MIYGAYLLGFVAMCCGVWMMYSEAMKSSSWFIPLNTAISIVCSLLWAYVIKNTSETNALYIRGLFWDAMIIGVYSLLPLMFGVKLNTTTAIGVAITLVGMVVVKIGG